MLYIKMQRITDNAVKFKLSSSFYFRELFGKVQSKRTDTRTNIAESSLLWIFSQNSSFLTVSLKSDKLLKK